MEMVGIRWQEPLSQRLPKLRAGFQPLALGLEASNSGTDLGKLVLELALAWCTEAQRAPGPIIPLLKERPIH